MALLTVHVYGGALASLAAKAANLSSDALKLKLITSGYTPAPTTDQYETAFGANEVATGSGYTSGGAAVTSVSVTNVAANSFSAVWAGSTAYNTGTFVRPSTGNGYIYRAAAGGTSSGSAPTWPTVIGTTVTDGGVTWTCEGIGALVLTFTPPSWSSFSATFRYVVLSDTTPGSAASNELIAVWDYGSSQTGGGGSFSLTVDPAGILIQPYR